MKGLTERDVRVLSFLRGKSKTAEGFISPTRIAQEVQSPKHHSAWASPICLKLTKMGLIMRNSNGHYQAIDREEE